MKIWESGPAGGIGFRNRRLGFVLALGLALYLAAVIGFIIIY
jgi:hypothetical protein